MEERACVSCVYDIGEANEQGYRDGKPKIIIRAILEFNPMIIGSLAHPRDATLHSQMHHLKTEDRDTVWPYIVGFIHCTHVVA